MLKRSPALSSPFVKGQLWKFDTRCIRIEHVGKLLVEHRPVHLDEKPSRARKQLMSIEALRRFLTANRGELLAS